ncbi:hybrid sensor histidine kinase/response regulator [Paenirhodobacter enshiensis]|uniref:hybrid sensor histidine kinase/response regulator n=1 Tax=Paenirhodobacter enshiensis TaxID=1105367 RepID=UPI0009DDC609|nr:ATP-binding protein [Paenirhodobacter enshiensis]
MIRAFQASGERRHYNRWVANETMEDFALRFTARRARRWTMTRVVNTALGSISFLALEAIGAGITLNWGFHNALAAIAIAGLIMLITSLPISYYAARYGIDIDLLTRGAGFGYLGSTLTSLVYAGFTFIFFALEASILAMALDLVFGLPPGIGYLVSALAVIPFVAYGFSKISLFQNLTQPFWVVLNLLPFVLLAFSGYDLDIWTGFRGRAEIDPQGNEVPALVAFGSASGVVLALIAQIGEQVDFLRFLPEPKTRAETRKWWLSVIAGGPGWVVLGALKMLAGSWLISFAVTQGSVSHDIHMLDPTALYHAALAEVIPSPGVALALTGALVILSQMKINVTNAYAGSIAWSNFFSRITHAHPGRVVWLVFNVAIAVLLMELGVFAAIETTLSLYAHVALAWIGALFADLTIDKPLGLSPRGIEFRRAHLYDVNPVGMGAMVGAAALSLIAHAGAFGPAAAALSPFVALGAAVVFAPAIALATRSRFYIARPAPDMAHQLIECSICQYRFDPEDMTDCPFHEAPICSLCCTLDASCGDRCRPHATLPAMIGAASAPLLPAGARGVMTGRFARFTLATATISGGIGALLWWMHRAAGGAQLDALLAVTFATAAIVTAVVVWLFLLSREARCAAQQDSERQTARLMREIRAHERTDLALQSARDRAEDANRAKTRYMAGLSHELRTPLNAIYGFAQILEADRSLSAQQRDGVRAIRRGSEHLAGLIEGLLDISKIEAGRLELNRVRVCLPDLLHQIVEIFEETARESGIGFVVSYRSALPDWVMVDEKRLRQVLINLLANAFRYTEKGEVRLRISWRNQVARIEVEDTGIGIAPEDLERIWQPFERGRGVKQRGSGLGLTITRLLVDIMGGEIRLASTPGRGSLFTLQIYLASVPALAAEPPLPGAVQGAARASCAARPALPDPAARPPAPERTAPAHYLGRTCTVAIVDDDEVHLTLMKHYLGDHGFNAISLPSAEAAQELIAQGDLAPDLFLIDIDMPGMNGWHLIRWLRTNGHRATPVVVLSGHAMEADPGPGEIALHDAFIAKPCILDDLLARIDDLLRLDRRSAGGLTEEDAPPPAGGSPDRPSPAPRTAEAPAPDRSAPVMLAADTLARLRSLAAGARLLPLRDALDRFELPAALRRKLRAALLEADFERILHELDACDPSLQPAGAPDEP